MLFRCGSSSTHEAAVYLGECWTADSGWKVDLRGDDIRVVDKRFCMTISYDWMQGQ